MEDVSGLLRQFIPLMMAFVKLFREQADGVEKLAQLLSDDSVLEALAAKRPPTPQAEKELLEKGVALAAALKRMVDSAEQFKALRNFVDGFGTTIEGLDTALRERFPSWYEPTN